VNEFPASSRNASSEGPGSGRDARALIPSSSLPHPQARPYMGHTSGFRPRVAGIRGSLSGSIWMGRLVCRPLPSAGWLVGCGRHWFRPRLDRIQESKDSNTEKQARATECTEIRIMTFRIGARPHTARSAPMLFCSVNSVVLACFSVLKTLTYFLCFIRRARRSAHVEGPSPSICHVVRRRPKV
jgi:hypothetical protein